MIKNVIKRTLRFITTGQNHLSVEFSCFSFIWILWLIFSECYNIITVIQNLMMHFDLLSLLKYKLIIINFTVFCQLTFWIEKDNWWGWLSKCMIIQLPCKIKLRTQIYKLTLNSNSHLILCPEYYKTMNRSWNVI